MTKFFDHLPENAGSITLRETVVGGTLLDRAIVDPPDLLETRDRVIFLVHGFNVTQDQAARSYDQFETRLSDEVLRSVVRLYWPGDTSTAGDRLRGEQGPLSRVISAVAYMFKPPIAMSGSQKLRKLLNTAFQARRSAGRNARLQICFVAHSLGCRLALETLERALVAKGTDAEMPLTVLMAAAVPQYLVETNGHLRGVLEELPQLWVLHSRRDTVLQRYFRPGQIFERAPFPSFGVSIRGAIGRKGVQPSETIKVLEGEWDHSDYWPDPDIAEAVDKALSSRRRYQPFEAFERVVWERSVQARKTEQRALTGYHVGW